MLSMRAMPEGVRRQPISPNCGRRFKNAAAARSSKLLYSPAMRMSENHSHIREPKTSSIIEIAARSFRTWADRG